MADQAIVVPTALREQPETPPAGVGPTLFQDYGANDFAGEAGALAKNDNWATTVYDYTPRYAPTIPTVPTPTGPLSFTGSSRVNPNASDEYLVETNDGGLAAALNNATYRVVFIAKGVNLSGLADQSMTSVGSGTSNIPRWVVYWDYDTPGNVQTIEPWNLSAANRVQMPRIINSGASHVYFVGVAWGLDGDHQKQIMLISGQSDNLTFYRILREYGNQQGILANGGDNLVVYKSVFRSMQSAGNENNEILIQDGTGHRIISCECYDWQNDFVQFGDQWGEYDAVVEDCDIYKVKRYDDDGTLNPSGIRTQGESAIAFKRVGLATADSNISVRIYGNRFWGLRHLSLGLDASNATGPCLDFSENTAKQRVDARWNVCEDCDINFWRAQSGANQAIGRHSIVRNIVADFRQVTRTASIPGADSAWNAPFYLGHDHTEMYLNTVVNSPNSEWFLVFYSPDLTLQSFDGIGNAFIDVSTTYSSTSHLDANSKFGYNAWAGNYTAYNKTYPIGHQEADKASLNMGNFTYKRRKLTNETTSTINGIVPTSNTPNGYLTAVPTSGGDQIGSRTGIGVDDVYT